MWRCVRFVCEFNAVLTTPGQVLLLLVKLYEASESPSWISISQCLVFLDQPAEVAAILHRLLGSSEVCTERLDRTRSVASC